ncbi:MAG: DUF6602 domain-containing protein [Candidatus Thorarchaeota archaeon]
MTEASIPPIDPSQELGRGISGLRQQLLKEACRTVEDFVSTQEPVFNRHEIGNAREQVIRDYLHHRFICHRFQIGNGTIYDRHDNTSRQVDVIVYDKELYRRFQNPINKNTYPIESMVSIGEIKTKLDITEINKAHKNIMSVMELNRINSVSGSDEIHDMFSFILASNSIKLENLMPSLERWRKTQESKYWPCTYLVVKKFMITTQKQSVSSELRTITDPHMNHDFEVQRVENKGDLLLRFGITLNEFLSRVKISRISLGDYIPR